MAAPGFLAVFSDPGSEATLEEFQDWYDNEHVPLRLNHLHYFLSGARYSAADGKFPGWLAMYEVDNAASFQDPSYTILRERRSDRETELIGRLGVLDRRTAEVVVDIGGQSGKSSGLNVGNPSEFIVTFGLALGPAGTSEQLQELALGTTSFPGWVRTRVIKVFDKGVTGRNEAWTRIQVPDYLGIIELASKLPWKKEQVPGGIQLSDWRQWTIYRAFSSDII